MQGFLQRLVDGIQPFAEQLGGPGLALVAMLDSSFLSLPEVPDLLMVVLTIQHPARWLYYALCTTAGSAVGTFALYSVARRGGDALLRRRFSAHRIDRALRVFRRFGLLAIVVPSLLPPPTPFKVFVLLAGVAQVRPATFVVAILVGRGLRYGGEAYLAYLYGDEARAFIRQYGPEAGIMLAAIFAALALAYLIWRRRSAKPA